MMRGRIGIAIIGMAAATVATLPLAPPAAAHEGRQAGDVEMVVGFGTEPAYAGYPNSVQLILSHHDGGPVTDLRPGDLGVEVKFGDATKELELEPFFEVGGFGEPGDYRAWFVPTRPGAYTFTFSGRVDGEAVDESFTSAPDTFSEVASPAAEAFPVQDPTNGELAERIDREVPRLSGEIAAARRAAEDGVGTATTVAVVGIAMGAIGLILGAAALATARKRG
jgi:hypothetical protein